MIDELLDAARSEQGLALDLDLCAVDLGDLVARTVPKPFDPVVLLDHVERAVTASRVAR